jgi:hypothetical protein
MRPSFKLKGIFVLAALAIGFAFEFFSGNFFCNLFWAYLEQHGYKEADVTAYTLAHIAPFLIVIGLVIGFYFFVRHEMTKTAAAPQQPQRDVWLYDAICRIFLGRWEQIPTKEGLLQLNQTESQAIYEIMERIRQFAFDDQLHIWRKRQGYETLWETPPSDFWKHNKIEYESFLDADLKKLQAIPIATSGQVVSLRGLMTSRSTIDALYSSHFSIQAIWIRMRSLVAGAWTKVEPSYVIILGLVIAAAGVAWQFYRGAPSPAHVAQIIAPFQAQIDTLKKQVDKPFFNSGPTPAPPPAPALPKRYTAYEKEQRLRAVDEIYNVIATQLQPAYSEGRKTVYDVYRAADDNAEQHLTEYANKVQAAFDNLNAILKKYSYFPDIVQAATKTQSTT